MAFAGFVESDILARHIHRRSPVTASVEARITYAGGADVYSSSPCCIRNLTSHMLECSVCPAIPGSPPPTDPPPPAECGHSGGPANTSLHGLDILLLAAVLKLLTQAV